MNIDRLSDDGAVKTVHDICNGLVQFATDNPECARDLLKELVAGALEPLAQDDFFGTEGWERGLGVE